MQQLLLLIRNKKYVFSHLRIDEYQKLTKNLGNLTKIADFVKKKMLKFETIKCSKQFHCYKTLCSALLTNLKGDCLVPEAGKTEKITKILKNLKKSQSCQRKLLKFVIFKS